MKIKSLSNILKRRWNILVYIWFGVMIIVLIYALSQPSLYETAGTVIIRPRKSLSLDRDFVRALDTLSRGDEIGSTFTEIINSNQIKRTVIENLKISPQLQVGLKIDSHTIRGTNILGIQVLGNDPQVVKAVADDVTSETMSRVEEIYGVFELEPLDNFIQPSQPIRSNIEIITMGFIIAIISSVGIVLLGEYIIKSGIIYQHLDFEPLLHSQQYFEYRLKQEISRSKNAKNKFSIAMIKNFDRQTGQELSRIYLDYFSYLVRQEDVIATLGRTKIGFIFPGMSAFQANKKFTAAYLDEANDSQNSDIGIKVGIVEFNNRDLDENGLIDLALQTIVEEVGQKKNKVYYFTNFELVAADDKIENVSLAATES